MDRNTIFVIFTDNKLFVRAKKILKYQARLICAAPTIPSKDRTSILNVLVLLELKSKSKNGFNVDPVHSCLVSVCFDDIIFLKTDLIIFFKFLQVI